MSRALMAKLLLGLVGLVLLGGLAVRAADPAQQVPSGHQHAGNGQAGDGSATPPDRDVSWPLLAGPTGVAVTFALATGVFWVVSRRAAARGRHALPSRRRAAATGGAEPGPGEGPRGDGRPAALGVQPQPAVQPENAGG